MPSDAGMGGDRTERALPGAAREPTRGLMGSPAVTDRSANAADAMPGVACLTCIRAAGVNFLCPCQRRLHVRDDVVGAHVIDELGLMKELCGLVAGAAQDQPTP